MSTRTRRRIQKRASESESEDSDQEQRQEEEDEEEWEQERGKKGKPTSSSSSASAAASASASAAFNYTDDDVDRLTADAVFWLLAQERKRAPFKKADVFKAVAKVGVLTARHREVQDRVWRGAARKLRRVFGIQLTDLNTDKKGLWYLVNQLTESADPELRHLTWSDRENARMGLLFAVLGFIFMSNDVVKDDVLLKFLG